MNGGDGANRRWRCGVKPSSRDEIDESMLARTASLFLSNQSETRNQGTCTHLKDDGVACLPQDQIDKKMRARAERQSRNKKSMRNQKFTRHQKSPSLPLSFQHEQELHALLEQSRLALSLAPFSLSMYVPVRAHSGTEECLSVDQIDKRSQGRAPIHKSGIDEKTEIEEKSENVPARAHGGAEEARGGVRHAIRLTSFDAHEKQLDDHDRESSSHGAQHLFQIDEKSNIEEKSETCLSGRTAGQKRRAEASATRARSPASSSSSSSTASALVKHSLVKRWSNLQGHAQGHHAGCAPASLRGTISRAGGVWAHRQ